MWSKDVVTAWKGENGPSLGLKRNAQGRKSQAFETNEVAQLGVCFYGGLGREGTEVVMDSQRCNREITLIDVSPVTGV